MSVALMGPSGGGSICTLKALDSYEKVLLWSNDSPNKAFPAQTVSFSDNTKYGLFFVVPVYLYNASPIADAPGTYVPNGVETIVNAFPTNSKNPWFRRMTITAGQAVISGGAFDNNNGVCIPHMIYGLKGTKMK